MANDLNRVILIGRLTRDPELKDVNGTALVNFSVANGKTYSSNGQKKEETHFFDCTAWGKLAEIIKQYATKGKQVSIEGKLQQRIWDSPEGKKMSKVSINVENLQLLGGNPNSSQNGSNQDYKPQTNNTEKQSSENIDIDDDGSIF